MNQDRIAVVAEGRSYTYADLDRASRSIAGELLGRGDDLQEARVAFLIPPGFDTPRYSVESGAPVASQYHSLFRTPRRSSSTSSAMRARRW